MLRNRVVQTMVIAVGMILVHGSAVSYAQAQNEQHDGQWCAYFTGGPTNCSFATFEECLQAIRGKTGLCNQSSQYVAPAARARNPGHRKPNRGRTDNPER